MKTRSLISPRIVWMISLAWVFSAGPALAQRPLSEERTKAFVADAERLVAEGQVDRALNRAKALLRRQGPRGNARLLFTLAWLHGEKAKTSPTPQDKTTHWKQAGRYYTRVLRQHRGHPQASENLARVHEDLGQADQALAVLSRVAKDRLSPEQNHQRLLKMGDLARSIKDFPRAYSLYLQAEKLQPENNLAPQRLVALYSQLPATWTDRFLETCARFVEQGHPESARRGYEAIMQRAAEDRAAMRAAQVALPLWVELEVQAKALSEQSLQRLPDTDDWNFRGLAELTNLLQQPGETDPDRLRYWTSDIERRHILAKALQSLGYQERLAGRPGSAEALYQQAFRLSPSPGEYGPNHSLGKKPIARLDVALDLAALYNAHPELDPGERKFRELEDPLLMEKNAAYGEQNLEAIQKFHTMFGLIYAQTNRNRWNEGSIYAAPYHLERAVSTARMIADREETEFKPLPNLIKIHADGLAAPDRNPRKAQELYLNAVQGYLDRDDLTEAKKALYSVEDLSKKLNLAPPPKQESLKNIIQLKSKVRVARPEDLSGASERLLRGLPEDTTTPTGRYQGLDPKFVNRQTVRVLTDASDRLYQAGQEETGRELRVKATEILEQKPGATQQDLEKLRTIPVKTPRKTGGDPKAVVPKTIDIRRVNPRIKTDQLIDPKKIGPISIDPPRQR